MSNIVSNSVEGKEQLGTFGLGPYYLHLATVADFANSITVANTAVADWTIPTYKTYKPFVLPASEVLNRRGNRRVEKPYHYEVNWDAYVDGAPESGFTAANGYNSVTITGWVLVDGGGLALVSAALPATVTLTLKRGSYVDIWPNFRTSIDATQATALAFVPA